MLFKRQNLTDRRGVVGTRLTTIVTFRIKRRISARQLPAK